MKATQEERAVADAEFERIYAAILAAPCGESRIEGTADSPKEFVTIHIAGGTVQFKDYMGRWTEPKYIVHRQAVRDMLRRHVYAF